VALSLEEHIH